MASAFALGVALAIQAPRPRQQGLVAVRIAHATVGLYVSKALVGDMRWRITNGDAMRGLSLLTYPSAFQMLQEAKWFQML